MAKATDGTVEVGKRVAEVLPVIVSFKGVQERDEKAAKLKTVYLDNGWDLHETHYVGFDAEGNKIMFVLVKYA